MYQQTDIEAIKAMMAKKEKTKGGSGDGGGLNWYKFPSGTERVVLRYLPAVSGTPGKIVKKHYNLPEVKDFLCFRTHDMDCDLCNLLRDYEHKIDTQDWVARSRSYLTALILEDPTQKIDPRQPVIVGQSEGNLYWVLEKILDKDIGDILDPYTGFNVAYKRTEFNGKFDRTILPKSQPIAADKGDVEAILGKNPDLNKIWRKPDDVFLKKLQDVTAKLKSVIDSRLMSLAAAGPAPTADTATPASGPTSTPSTPPPAAASAPKSNRPANAPECFSDSKVFYKNEATGEADPNKSKCVSCAFDFHCGEEIKKREKANA